MPNNFLKKITGRFAETIVTVFLVLIFFSVILGLLNFFFPSGSGIRNLIGRGIFSQDEGSRDRDIMMSFGNRQSGLSSGKVEAVLTEVRNTVKKKRSNDIAWHGAREGTLLFNMDAVQTLQDSTARIDFDKDNFLNMGENSLVIIKRLDHDPFLREKRSILVMVDGELKGKIARSGDSAVHMELTTPSAVAKIMSAKSGDGQAEFKISVNADKSSTVTVFHGTAEVTAQGQTVVVEQNQSATVSMSEPPQAPRDLTERVAPLLPVDNSRYYYRELPPRVRFTWTAPAGEKGFYFNLARDPGFKDMVFDDRLSSPSFTYGNLRQGTYFWRAYGAILGPDKVPYHTLQVIQDREPPLLEVSFPPDRLDGKEFMLKGKTEAGAILYIMGAPSPVSETGEFTKVVQLKRGPNVIVVEAIDHVGNVSYRSKTVNVKF